MSEHLERIMHEDRYVYGAKLVRVVDGDTVVLDVDLGFGTWLHNQHCRLLGINAPETHTETREAGEAATAWLRELLADTEEILIRSHLDKKDSFRRLLIELWADGHDINYCMVQDGHARSVE